MLALTFTDAEKILIAAGCETSVVEHCRAVSRLASSIAENSVITVDIDLVKIGGLLHDIGRARSHGIDHALVGSRMAKELKFPPELVDIIECHIGAGITAVEAERLGLPKQDYLPSTPEQKIVSYADNLLSGVREMSFSEALERFKRVLGPAHESVDLFQRQHEEIQSWMRKPLM